MVHSINEYLSTGLSPTKEAERVQETEGMEDTQETRHSEHNRMEVHMNSRRLYQHAQGLHKSNQMGHQRGNKWPHASIPEAISK